MELLPKWVLPPAIPSVYDTESATAIEMVAKLYGAMNTLIEEYNKFAAAADKGVSDFTEEEKAAREKFEEGVTKVMREFQCSVNNHLVLNLHETATDIINRAISGGELEIHDTVARAAIAVESARISALASLKEGSTTGDAELADVRVAFDGKTYATAGEAVRGQAKTSIRPNPWAIKNTSITNDGKNTVFDLESNYFYRLSASIPDGFGLPLAGYNGTLVIFDASNKDQNINWFRVFVCTLLVGSDFKTFVAYADSMRNLKWKEITIDVDAKIRENVAQHQGIILGVGRPKIVLLGDSITAGVGSSDYAADGDLVISKTYSENLNEVYRNTGAKGWGQLFKAYMESTYPGCSVVNNGWPGVTTWMLSDSMAELVPDDCEIAIVQVGTNSRTQEDKTTKIIQPMEEIIDYLRNKGITPIIMTNTVLKNQTAPNDAYNVRQCIMAACAAKGVYCYDALGEMEMHMWAKDLTENDIMADDLHPNNVGHELIYKVFRKLLRV